MANKIKINDAIKRQFRQSKKPRSKNINCRILIVCEGEKTEPNYFKAFGKDNNQIELIIHGGGINTVGVVDEAIRLRNNSSLVPFDRIWAVFDKDDFTPNSFNSAIIKARKNCIETAWSNEAFELWFLYHFKNCTASMGRDRYGKALSKAVNDCLDKGNKKYVYIKNDIKTHQILTKWGNQKEAIKWAETQHKQWSDEKFANHNPCTTVYKLVRQLIGEDKELNDEITKKMNSQSDNNERS